MCGAPDCLPAECTFPTVITNTTSNIKDLNEKNRCQYLCGVLAAALHIS
jgi:hypothetical protein